MGVRLRNQPTARPSYALKAAEPAATRPGRISALPAVKAPPGGISPPVTAPPLPGRETLPQIVGEARAPSYAELPESVNDWLRRNTSFAVSLVVHLLALIALALWAFHEPNEKTQIVLFSNPRANSCRPTKSCRPPQATARRSRMHPRLRSI